MFYTLLATYAKCYIMDSSDKCIAKKKTKSVRKTLEPVYQQKLQFPISITDKTLEVNVHLAPLNVKY